MAIKYLLPKYGNVLVNACTIAVSPSADTLFPSSHLFDQYPSIVMKNTSSVNYGIVRIHCNLVEFYNFTTGWAVPTVPDGWTDDSSTSGSLARSTGVDGRASVLQLTATSGTAATYQDITVLSGWRMKTKSFLYGDGSNGPKIYIKNLDTGEYLDNTTAGTASWNATSEVVHHTITSCDWSGREIGFTVTDYTTTQRHLCTLRVTIKSTEGITYADGVRIWPEVDFISIHNHNLSPKLVELKLQASTIANVTSELNVNENVTIKQPSFYHLVTSADKASPYWRIAWIGTNDEVPKLGEVVFGQYVAPSTTMKPTYAKRPLSYSHTSIEQRVVGGNIHRTKLSDHYSRNRTLKFSLRSSDAYDDAVELFDRSAGGTEPVVLVLNDDKDEVLFGYIGSTLPVEEDPTGKHFSWTLNFEELPFGLDTD